MGLYQSTRTPGSTSTAGAGSQRSSTKAPGCVLPEAPLLRVWDGAVADRRAGLPGPSPGAGCRGRCGSPRPRHRCPARSWQPPRQVERPGAAQAEREHVEVEEVLGADLGAELLEAELEAGLLPQARRHLPGERGLQGVEHGAERDGAGDLRVVAGALQDRHQLVERAVVEQAQLLAAELPGRQELVVVVAGRRVEGEVARPAAAPAAGWCRSRSGGRRRRRPSPPSGPSTATPAS